jgi:hypothetical protein
MSGMTDDFYEDDEPVGKILGKFTLGQRGTTHVPSPDRTPDFPDNALSPERNNQAVQDSESS